MFAHLVLVWVHMSLLLMSVIFIKATEKLVIASTHKIKEKAAAKEQC